MRRGPRRAALLALAATMLAACGGGAPVAKPNLVLISIDTLRADHLGAYGYGRATSPNLDRLAREGVLFEHAYSTASWTLPSHVSMLTGLYPSEHGVVTDKLAIPRERTLLPEALAPLGYRSAAVVSTVPFLRRSYGFNQGWESYDDRTLYRKAEHWQRVSISPKLYDATLRQLDRLGEGPFFLFVHDYDVHWNYVPPPPFETMFGPPRGVEPPAEVEGAARRGPRLMAQYDGEIAWVDSWIGKLVAELGRRGLLERTVVAVVADHGEEFYEHGRQGHGVNLYDTVLHVPWIVRFPGARWAGRRIAEPVSLVDVPATLMALAGSADRRWNSGRDVSRWLAPGAVPEPADLFAFRTPRGNRGLMAIVSGGYKALLPTDLRERPRLPPEGLFRIGDDPGETRDLSAAERVRVAELHRSAIAALAVQLRTRSAQPARVRGKISPEDEARLRALGYL